MNMTRTTMKLLFSIFLLLNSYVGITQTKSEIIGKMKNGSGKMVYLLHEERGKVVAVDSAKVNLFGAYKLTAEVVLTDFYQLTTDRKEGILLLLKGKEKVKIKSGASLKEKNYQISGSKDSELIQEFLSVKSNENVSKDSLKEYASQFVEKNASSLAVFVALNETKDIKKALEQAEKGIGETYPNTMFHNSLKTALASISRAKSTNNKAAVGQLAPEVNMPNPDGKIIPIESLRGKVVLIDFWASWCGPCRRENPNVVKLYHKYKDQGFEVYSVSLDNNKEKWLQAIEKDQLSWPSHVSDLKGWGSAATSIYGFRGIPYTVLVDRQGKIIQTRLRGAALERKLAEIFAE